MATLSVTELQAIRNFCASKLATVPYDKPTLNAAAQAVETLLTNNAAAISTAIDNATAPVVLTNAQKKLVVAYVLYVKFVRDSV